MGQREVGHHPVRDAARLRAARAPRRPRAAAWTCRGGRRRRRGRGRGRRAARCGGRSGGIGSDGSLPAGRAAGADPRPATGTGDGGGDAMGLLDGKKALIFGVANDHSIAWGIAQALHGAGATVGFASVESLIERRVRPLAASIGATFVEACDVQSDDEIRAVMAKWAAAHGQIDVLVHAAGVRAPGGRSRASSSTPTRAAFATGPRRLRLQPRGDGPRRARPLLRPARRVLTLSLLRGREGRRQLQRHGRRQGRPRGVRPVPRRRPGPGGRPGQRHQRRAGPDALGVRGRATSGSCTASFARGRPAALEHHDRGRRQDRPLAGLGSLVAP